MREAENIFCFLQALSFSDGIEIGVLSVWDGMDGAMDGYYYGYGMVWYR